MAAVVERPWSDWRGLRQRRDLPLALVAYLTGIDLPRLVAIDLGDVAADPGEVAAMLRLFRPDHPAVVDVPPLAAPDGR